MSTLSRRRPFPWLMFVGPDTEGGTSLTPEQFLEKHGYPKDTATDDMNDAQKAAYWRTKSKGFQKDAEDKGRELAKWTALGEFDTVSTTVTGAEAARLAALSDSQRAQEQAQQAEAAARAAGQAEGRNKYLGEAVEARLVALTIRPGEKPEDATARVKDALSFVDASRFLDEHEALDTAKVTQFAQSLGSGGQQADGDGVLHTLYQRQTPPAPGSGGSIKDMRERKRDELSGSKK